MSWRFLVLGLVLWWLPALLMLAVFLHTAARSRRLFAQLRRNAELAAMLPARDDGGAWLEQGCWREDATAPCPACTRVRQLAAAHPRLGVEQLFAVVRRQIEEGRCPAHTG